MRRKAIAIGKGVIQKEPNYVFYWLRFLIGFCYGLIAPIYALFLFSRGLDAFQVSLTNLAFVLGILLFQLPAGALADTWGRKRTFLISMVFNSLSFLVYGFGKVWVAFIVAEVISALGFCLMVGVLEAWAVDAWKQRTAGKEYSFLFSRAETASNSASMFGGLLGGLIASISLQLPFLVGGVIFLSVLIMGYFLIEEKRLTTRVKVATIINRSVKMIKSGTKESLEDKFIWQVAFFGGIAMIGFKVLDMFWSKRFVDMFNGRVWVTGYIWPLMTVFMIIGNYLLKWWTDRKKDYLTGFIINILFASIAVFLSSIFKSFYLAIFFFLLYEISRGIQRPALFGYFNKIIPDKKRATILSFSITVSWLGGAVGLLTLGWAAKRFSIETAWIGASMVFLLALIPIIRLRRAKFPGAS